MVKKVKILKVLRMGLPVAENLSGPRGSIFSLFSRPKLHFGKKKFKKMLELYYIHRFSLIPLVWGPLGCCHFPHQSRQRDRWPAHPMRLHSAFAWCASGDAWSKLVLVKIG